MKEKKDPFILYKILNVEKTATEDEIKAQYRKLAIQFHPDKNSGSEESKQNFQRIQEAYNVLRDSEKRKIYDRTGNLIRRLDRYSRGQLRFLHPSI